MENEPIQSKVEYKVKDYRENSTDDFEEQEWHNDFKKINFYEGVFLSHLAVTALFILCMVGILCLHFFKD